MADKYPVIEELLDELHNSMVISKLELKLGYHEILLKPEDAHKTSFLNSRRTLRVPSNALRINQRAYNISVLHD